MKTKYLLPIIAATLIMSGCSSFELSDSSSNAESANGSINAQSEDGAQGEASDDDSDKKDAESSEPGEELSADELSEFTDLFNTMEYNGFLEDGFNSPEEIDWEKVLKLGAGISSQDCGKDEANDVLTAMGYDPLIEYSELNVIKKTDLADFIKRHTGKDLMPATEDLSWEYFEKFDSFYKVIWDHEHRYVGYECISGKKSGDEYTVRLKVSPEKSTELNSDAYYGIYADRIVKFTKSGNDLVFESNEIQWDDHCVPEQTFDVDLAQYDSPVHFVTYQEKPDQAEMIIEKDGKFIDNFVPSFSDELQDIQHIKTIEAVGFFDIDANGMDDIAYVGDSGHGKCLSLLLATTDSEEPFAYFVDIREKQAAEMGTDLTINGIKSVILGDNKDGKYDNYKEAYAQIANIYKYNGSDMDFDLIYVDDDDIPELVLGPSGYWVTLYTFKNGHTHLVMDRWAYGAMGNVGYSYAEKENVVYNGNADHAGAIYYNTYMSINDDGELKTTVWSVDNNFNDINGDGVPSEEELASSDDYEVTSEYHNNVDKNMSEDEIKKMIEKYDSLSYKEIRGTLDYDSFMEKLNK